jgi:hypothetical protein
LSKELLYLNNESGFAHDPSKLMTSAVHRGQAFSHFAPSLASDAPKPPWNPDVPSDWESEMGRDERAMRVLALGDTGFVDRYRRCEAQAIRKGAKWWRRGG